MKQHAKTARKQSQSGIYHVILRGINKQVIFEDEQDKERFMWCLHYYKEVGQYKIYGYCLMNNHIHLLIKEGNELIAKTMKRIGVSYVSWFNRKYGRCGPLFQDRFKSEVVESDEYFLMVLRYIHQNPLKTGEVKKMSDYHWSSYQGYFGYSNLVDTDFAMDMFSSDPEIAVRRFEKFMNEKTEDAGVMVYGMYKLTDLEARLAIQETAKLTVATELQTMEKQKRDEILRKIKQINGISTRQIARLTGITQSVIVRA
ncbi:transposase [Dendrosporobacter sp. 1207_IL3150]|uniref:transposase n=1 Tax=Dendrosporobacter sp. 1207_IL3150 TaxID=3084054 RepID=UPI002FD931B0